MIYSLNHTALGTALTLARGWRAAGRHAKVVKLRNGTWGAFALA